ncbi:MAG: adenylate kinase [Bryobacterales bacterium]|nr:adenylate kinase [Bryobacterales bacterium]
MREGGGRALILLGPPGSGKGTQARLIRECLKVPHISTGDMLRDRMQAGDSLGMIIKRLIDEGELVTDELVNRMVQERISKPDCGKGFILDGYPRTLSQAGMMCRQLADRGTGWLVVHLKVDYNEIIRRLAGRRSCPGCGAVYHLTSHPPAVAGLCDRCGNSLSIRDDDRESVVRKRLEAYEERTRPLLEFFSEEEGSFCEVDGAGDAPPLIAERICSLARSGRPGGAAACSN